MRSRFKVLVNAIPMINVNTGISRYLRCLYSEMERSYGNRLEIGYFDGWRVSSKMPSGPANLGQWTRSVDLFWKMPAYLALATRLGIHAIRERIFWKLCRDFNIYHEAGFFPFAVPKQTKTVFTVCDLSQIRFPRYHPKERVLFSRLFFKRRCRTTNHFITLSKFVAKEMQELLNIREEEISVTGLACDTNIFYPRSIEESQPLLERLSLFDRYFLFVGGGDPRKNLDIVPIAIEKAAVDIPLVVAGWSGWSRQQAWENVIPSGYISDDELAKLYSRALALIFPSSYEGFGLPLLEAMACDCPVVTAKVASLPEVAGNAALYIENPRDINALSKMLTRLFLDDVLVKALRWKGRTQAKAFSWEKTAQTTFEVFLKMLYG